MSIAFASSVNKNIRADKHTLIYTEIRFVGFKSKSRVFFSVHIFRDDNHLGSASQGYDGHVDAIYASYIYRMCRWNKLSFFIVETCVFFFKYVYVLYTTALTHHQGWLINFKCFHVFICKCVQLKFVILSVNIKAIIL